MPMADSSKITDLMLKQLRKSFKNIESVRDGWKTSQNSALSALDSLENVAEQYYCTLRVTVDQSHSGDLMLVKCFPDIHKRLQYKLIQEMELLVGKLQGNCNEMQALHTKVHQQYINSMTVYRKSSHHLPLDNITEGTATWPSVADMLEWLHDLDTLFQFLYENQLQVWTSVDYNNEELMKTLAAKWKKGNQAMEESLTNVLALVSFFMADG